MTSDEQAALAVIESLTRWFGDGESMDNLEPLAECDQSEVVGVLFGLYVGAIELLCEETGQEPLDYLQDVAMSVQMDIAGLVD